jgi:glycosyltransferase involved in cell wall biosynthesis
MNHRKLKKYYDRMDVILSPSLFETYGNVAQESLVHGTPALVNSNMGVAETYRKFGLDRWITDFTSPSMVYDKIEEVSQSTVDYEMRRQLASELSPHKIHTQLMSVIKGH